MLELLGCEGHGLGLNTVSLLALSFRVVVQIVHYMLYIYIYVHTDAYLFG